MVTQVQHITNHVQGNAPVHSLASNVQERGVPVQSGIARGVAEASSSQKVDDVASARGKQVVNRERSGFKRFLSGCVGALLGAVAGAALGAVVGGVVGTVVPGLGTSAGAAFGAIVGFAVGAYLGFEIGKVSYDGAHPASPRDQTMTDFMQNPVQMKAS